MKLLTYVSTIDLISGQALAAGPLSRFWTTFQVLMALILTLFTRGWLLLLDGTFLESLSGWGTIATAAVIGVLFHYLIIQAVNLILVSLWVVCTPRLRQGVLGEHEFELKPEGLVEKTAFNETLHAWNALDRPKSFGSLIMLPAGPGRWHIIPRRSFSSRGEERLFLNEVEGRLVT